MPKRKGGGRKPAKFARRNAGHFYAQNVLQGVKLCKDNSRQAIKGAICNVENHRTEQQNLFEAAAPVVCGTGSPSESRQNPNNQIPPPADPPGGGTEPNLPKTQEELDALINTRLKRAEKDWLKKQKQAQQPPAAPPSASHAEGEGEPAEDNSAALHREIVETRAQLAAYKEGINPSSGGRSAACHACCRKIGG